VFFVRDAVAYIRVCMHVFNVFAELVKSYSLWTKMRKYITLHVHPWLAVNPGTLWSSCLTGNPVSQGEYAISRLAVSTLEPWFWLLLTFIWACR